MIKNIVFDMGNVLIRYNARDYVGLYVKDRKEGDYLCREIFQSVEWIMQDRGILKQEELYDKLCRKIPEQYHPIMKVLIDNWHHEIPPYPEMEALIAALKEQGYKIYLLSNTSNMYFNFRKNIPALKYFDGEFVSCDYRLVKPDPKIYTTFTARYGLNPSECFFIDDNNANLEAALYMGWKGEVYRGVIEDLKAALRREGVRI